MTLPIRQNREVQKGPHEEMLSGEKKQLFVRHMPLVGFVVKKLLGFGSPPVPLEYADLVQLGMIGLMDAIERFDPSRGVQFQTYAVSRIKGTIQDELRKLDWIPRSVRKLGRDYDVILQKAEEEGSATESHEDIARRLSMTMEEYRAILLYAAKNISDAMLDVNEEGAENHFLATAEEDDPSVLIHQKQVREEVHRAIDKLEQRDKIVLVLYYYEELTFKEIARILRISESRAYQIHDTVIQYLRKRLKRIR